ncbi:MAG: hypothetical protein KBS51_03000 [Lachnospiraceae bacterium]|nr:hypothetical protein [Candidatus Darwinimomas equi]
MIKELVKEVYQCLDNDSYMAALIVALTLPDICGKAEYAEEKPRKRYVDWYDDYVNNDDNNGLNHLSHSNGELVYSLRCSLLHQGNPNIDVNKLNYEYFELIWQGNKRASYTSESYSAEIVVIDGKEEPIHRRYSVNILNLCDKICTAALSYYNKYQQKFDFLDYHLSSMDERTRINFKIDPKIVKLP